MQRETDQRISWKVVSNWDGPASSCFYSVLMFFVYVCVLFCAVLCFTVCCDYVVEQVYLNCYRSREKTGVKTCSQHNEDQQHQLQNEERSDDEVDGGHVDSAVDFRRTIGKVNVVPVDEVFQQHIQQSCNQQHAKYSLDWPIQYFNWDVVFLHSLLSPLLPLFPLPFPSSLLSVFLSHTRPYYRYKSNVNYAKILSQGSLMFSWYYTHPKMYRYTSW